MISIVNSVRNRILDNKTDKKETLSVKLKPQLGRDSVSFTNKPVTLADLEGLSARLNVRLIDKLSGTVDEKAVALIDLLAKRWEDVVGENFQEGFLGKAKSFLINETGTTIETAKHPDRGYTAKLIVINTQIFDLAKRKFNTANEKWISELDKETRHWMWYDSTQPRFMFESFVHEKPYLEHSPEYASVSLINAMADKANYSHSTNSMYKDKLPKCGGLLRSFNEELNALSDSDRRGRLDFYKYKYLALDKFFPAAKEGEQAKVAVEEEIFAAI